MQVNSINSVNSYKNSNVNFRCGVKPSVLPSVQTLTTPASTCSGKCDFCKLKLLKQLKETLINDWLNLKDIQDELGIAFV
jgi:hypothetical protein